MVVHQDVNNRVAQKWQTQKENKSQGKGLRFEICPHCGKKGFYKIPRLYEYCRYCGLHRILLPGQDF